jgi:hypothetical protein
MRLLQRILPTLRQTNKPQQQFVAHLLGLLLMFSGHATFRNLSRYSSYHERTFSRWYARDFDFVSLNKAAITEVILPEHEQALVIDASFVPKSGKKTYGLDRFWNGSHGRSEKGLEISTLAWLDITDNCAYCLSVEQTPPTDKTSDAEATRVDVYLDQLAQVVSEHELSHLSYVITDGYYSKQKFTGGVRALGLEQIGKLRLDANLRYLYQGPKRPGPGRPKTYDGKVHGDNLSRFEHVETADEAIVLSHQVLNHVPCQRNLRVVLVVDTKHHRRAVLLRTDVNLDARTRARDDKARCPIALLGRDANQGAGLTAWHARSPAQLNFHCHASLSAGPLATRDACQQNGGAASACSRASLTRRACNQHLIERIAPH